MILVAIESPYAGRLGPDFAQDEARNVLYLKHAIQDCLARGESPYASHEMFTRALADGDPEQRAKGIAAGFYWARQASYRVLYLDRGFTPGMQAGLEDAVAHKQPIVLRGLAEWRSHMRLEALRKLQNHLDGVTVDIDWSGF